MNLSNAHIILRFVTFGWLYYAAILTSSAQNTDSLLYIGSVAVSEDRYEDALVLYKNLLEMDLADSQLLAKVYYGMGEAYYWQRENNDKAEECYKKVEELLEGISEEFNDKLLKATTRLGYLYRYRNIELRKALIQFKKEELLINKFEKQEEISETRKFRNAYNLASTTRLLDDYNTALNYAFKSLSIAQNQQNENDGKRNQAFAYSVIANILGNMNRLEEATSYYLKKIETTIGLNGPNDESVANDYNNIGHNYIQDGNYEKAIAYLEKSLRILEVDEPNQRLLSNTYRQLGIAYSGSENFNLSKSYFNRAINTIDKPLPIQTALAHRSKAELFEKLLLFDSALLSYQEAIGTLIPDFKWKKIEDNPTTEQLFTEPLYYRLLNMKAACWLKKYKYEGDKTALINANVAFQLMNQLTDDFRNNFTLESSKLFFQDWNYEHYVEALESVYELYIVEHDTEQVSQAWTMIEKNKSLLMLENLLSAERLDESSIPDSVLNAQSMATKEIWNLQSDIRACNTDPNCNEGSLIQFRTQFSEAQKRLETSRQAIRAQFPDYYSIALDKEILSLEQLSKYVSSNQLMINYFATDSAFFVLASNGNQVIYEKITRYQESEEMLNQFINESSGSTLVKGNLRESYLNFTEASHYLFQLLLAPFLNRFDVDEIIIIPDGLLALVPFEAMIRQPPSSKNLNYASLDYVINNYKIQYGYSATLWSKHKTKLALNNNASLLALGSSGERSSLQLANLQGTTAEASALAHFPNATVLLGDSATEQNFKLASTKADIIHLALHNVNDLNNPLNTQLIFNDSSGSEDGALHLYELFGLNINPSLVVLSACETGVSEWKKGEGPYHIGRGFLFHGNPAMILSLWKVRDKTASQLMQTLYANLYSGDNSVEALRKAKLEWIASADELTAHPSNWAAFVGIGHVKKSDNGNTHMYWFFLVVLGIVALYIAKLRQSA